MASNLTVQDIWHNGKSTASQVAQLYFNAANTQADDDEAIGATPASTKTYIITGATSGLGRQLALVLGTASIGNQQPLNLILAVRNVDQGRELSNEILLQNATTKPGNQVENATVSPSVCNIQVWPLDLSRLESVRQFVDKFKEWSASKIGDNERCVRLDGLINNAGVHGVKGLSEDGFLTTWQVNALAPFLLTRLLEPYLSNDARVVNVSSLMHSQVATFDGIPALGGLNLAASCKKNVDITSKCPPKHDRATSYDYALSKACQVLHAHALTLQFAKERAAATNCRRLAFAVDPGVIRTNLSRNQTCSESFFERCVFQALYGRSVDQGCSTILFCLLAPVQHLQPDIDLKTTDQGIDHGTPPYYYFNCAPAEPVGYCQDAEQAMAMAKLFDELLGRPKCKETATETLG